MAAPSAPWAPHLLMPLLIKRLQKLQPKLSHWAFTAPAKAAPLLQPKLSHCSNQSCTTARAKAQLLLQPKLSRCLSQSSAAAPAKAPFGLYEGREPDILAYQKSQMKGKHTASLLQCYISDFVLVFGSIYIVFGVCNGDSEFKLLSSLCWKHVLSMSRIWAQLMRASRLVCKLMLCIVYEELEVYYSC